MLKSVIYHVSTNVNYISFVRSISITELIASALSFWVGQFYFFSFLHGVLFVSGWKASGGVWTERYINAFFFRATAMLYI